MDPRRPEGEQDQVRQCGMLSLTCTPSSVKACFTYGTPQLTRLSSTSSSEQACAGRRHRVTDLPAMLATADEVASAVERAPCSAALRPELRLVEQGWP
jgi:hypothetical protein